MKAYTQQRKLPHVLPDLTRPSAKPLARPAVHPIMQLQRTIGNQSVLRLLHANAAAREVRSGTSAPTPFAQNFGALPVGSKSPLGLQPRLSVNTPGDIYEQEADSVAAQVTSMTGPELQRSCSCDGACAGRSMTPNDHEHLQMKSVQASDSLGLVAPPIVHETLGSPGQPLDRATREFMEPRFGHDFSRVRVHTDSRAAHSAWAVGARAYAVGQHIAFAENQFHPESKAGKALLAHELAHTIQQDWRGDTSGLQSNIAPKDIAGGSLMREAPLHHDITSVGPLTLMRQVASDDKEKDNLESPLFKGIVELEMTYDGDLTIGPGASGEYVRRIQIALLMADPDALTKSGPNGHYDQATKAAVMRYQKTHCLKVSHGNVIALAQDGLVGRETLSCLDRVTGSKVSAADVGVLASRFKGNADPFGNMREKGIDLAIGKGLDVVEKTLDWGAERMSTQLVKKGKLVDTFGKMRQSPGKTKAGEWKHVGGKTRRGKFTTKYGAKPSSATIKGMKLTSNFIGEVLGPAMDVVGVAKTMEGNGSAMSEIVDLLAGGLPLSMVAEDELRKIDDELFEFALNQGYESTVRYIQNCNTCRKMTDDMAILYVTAAEYEDAFAGKLEVTESVRKRVLPVYPMKQSSMEFYQKLAGVGPPLKFAILLYRTAARIGKTVDPIAGFDLPN